MKTNRAPARRSRAALRITLIYVVAASLWIVLSDWLLATLARGAPEALVWQTVKGLGFVAVSAVIIYLLVEAPNTHRERAETQLRKLSRAVEQSASAIIIADVAGRIEYVNPRFTALTGYTLEEVLGQNPRILKSGTKSPEEYSELWQTITSGRDWRGEFFNKAKDGSYYWVSATISPIRDAQGHITHFLAVEEDITAQKVDHEKLQQRNQELTLLNRVISAAASTLKVEEVLSVACREMAATFDVPLVGLALRSEDRRTFEVVVEYGGIESGTTASLGKRFSAYDNPALSRLTEQHQPCMIVDVRKELGAGPTRDIMLRRGAVSVLLLPLLVRDDLVGMIELCTAQKREFTREEIRLAFSVSAAVSQALDNARLYERVSRHNDVLVRAVAERTEELQRVKERVEAILNNSPDAILLLLPDGRIETANLSFAQLFGVDGDTYATPIGDFAVPEDRPLLQQGVEAAVGEHRVARVEITARRADGSTFDAGIALAAFDEGDKQRLVCVVRDITALKEVERMKDAFVSNVSHELRTPITSLKLHHHLLRINPDKHDVYMERLEREIERLSHIIEDLLTLSRMDQERINLEIESVDLNELLSQYVADRQLMARDHGLQLVHDGSTRIPPVHADRGLIGQVLSILLTNAFNYTPPGGRVTARTLRCADGAWLGFSITDTGLGIPPDEQAHVFDRFFRGQAAKETGAAGTGLGLAIAREIVERHDGRIEVESGPQGGAAFHVWLPADRS